MLEPNSYARRLYYYTYSVQGGFFWNFSLSFFVSLLRQGPDLI